MRRIHEDFLIFLGDGNELTFPAIGSIVLEESNNDNFRDFKLNFTPFSSHNYVNQLSYFSNLWDKSEIEVNRFFIVLSDKILAHCQQNKEFLLPSLGVFSLQNNQVYFLSSYSLEDEIRTYYGQSGIPSKSDDFSRENIRKLDFDVKHKTSSVSNSEESRNTESIYISRPKYYRQIAVILLLVIASFSGFYVYKSLADSFTFPANFDLRESGYTESDYNRSPNEKEFQIQEVSPYERKSSYSDSISISKKDIILAPGNPTSDEFIATGNENDLHTNKDFCTFILGSFTSTQNVENLIIKINGIHETPILFYSNNFTRVGVNIPCGNQSRMSNLLAISPEMWLLEE